MPTTFQAVAAVLFALLPGALFTWSYEQQLSRSNSHLADRLQRLIGASALFLAVYAPLLYKAYRELVVTGDFTAGRPLPWWVWLVCLGLLVAPWLVGRLVGSGVRHRSKWTRILTGPSPAPRAWDHLFSTPKLTGWVRLKLKDGTWIFGAWGVETVQGPDNAELRSYAAGYPEAQDLYFVDTAEIDEDGLPYMENERPIMRGAGVLVRWDEVAYLEFVEA